MWCQLTTSHCKLLYHIFLNPFHNLFILVLHTIQILAVLLPAFWMFSSRGVNYVAPFLTELSKTVSRLILPDVAELVSNPWFCRSGKSPLSAKHLHVSLQLARMLSSSIHAKPVCFRICSLPTGSSCQMPKHAFMAAFCQSWIFWCLVCLPLSRLIGSVVKSLSLKFAGRPSKLLVDLPHH
jgi:hypothetical protein